MSFFPKVSAGNIKSAYLKNDWKNQSALVLKNDTVFTHLDATTIQLGKLKKVVLYFGRYLAEGGHLETKGKTIDLSMGSYALDESGNIVNTAVNTGTTLSGSSDSGAMLTDDTPTGAESSLS